MSFKLIVDKFHNNIELSEFDNWFLKNPFLNRLHRILQNSTAYMVFPCCKTARFEHSIGTLNYASEIFLNGLHNSTCTTEYLNNKKELFKDISDKDEFENEFSASLKGNTGELKNHLQINKLSELIESDIALKYLKDLVGKEFIARNIRTKGTENNNFFTVIILLQSLRIQALLHDVGHLPFSHLFEFSLENIHNELREKNKLSKLKNEILINIEGALKTETGNSTDNKIHEIVGKNLTRFIFADLKNEILRNNRDDIEKKGLLMFAVCIIQHSWEEIIKGKAGHLNSLYNIVSSSLDADRLDYIQRDGAMSGLIKSSGNIDRIVKMFVLSNRQPDSADRYIFLPAVQSLFDVEVVLSDRFTIYKYMVNHHAVKRSDYLLQRAIELIINNELKRSRGFSKAPEVKYLIDIIRVINGLTTKNIDTNFQIVAYEFTQITDFWLLTLLNKRYIRLAVNQTNSCLSDILGEIFENRKKICSLWKRKFEYYEFSVSLGRRLIDKYRDFKIDKNRVTERTLYKYEELNVLMKEANSSDEHYAKVGFLLVDLLKEKYKNNWTKRIEESFKLENCRILVAPYNNSTGIKDLYLIDNKDHAKIMEISQVSSIHASLQEELKTSTRFFVYYFGQINNKATIQQKIEDSVLTVLNKIIVNN